MISGKDIEERLDEMTHGLYESFDDIKFRSDYEDMEYQRRAAKERGRTLVNPIRLADEIAEADDWNGDPDLNIGETTISHRRLANWVRKVRVLEEKAESYDRLMEEEDGSVTLELENIERRERDDHKPYEPRIGAELRLQIRMALRSLAERLRSKIWLFGYDPGSSEDSDDAARDVLDAELDLERAAIGLLNYDGTRPVYPIVDEERKYDVNLDGAMTAWDDLDRALDVWREAQYDVPMNKDSADEAYHEMMVPTSHLLGLLHECRRVG